ncbi:MAG TPA: diacylglycerol kinase family protein [Ohtaekwangia sp.]|nr:diacylglycerol kinase family protein [Ohtaekwangia sp.]
MKNVELLHNPAAGDGQLGKKDLLDIIRAEGFECSYSSTKKDGWEEVAEEQPDFIAAAGGDGTIRKLARKLLDRKVLDPIIPVALLPLGTANNIARALGISGDPVKIVQSWRDPVIKKFDVGRIYGVAGHSFFLEGFGYGVFPALIKKLKDKNMSADPEEAKAFALQALHEIIMTYRPKYCKIITDGVDHSGTFLLAEIMNVRSIGPNLNLAPAADPGDGNFNIVLIPETQREEFAQYVMNKLNGREELPVFSTLQARRVKITWGGALLHVDDEIESMEKNKTVRVRLRDSLLEFFVPPRRSERE